MRPRGLELRPDHDALLLVRGTRAIVVSELKSLRSLGESRRSMIAVTSKVNSELCNTARKERARWKDSGDSRTKTLSGEYHGGPGVQD